MVADEWEELRDIVFGEEGVGGANGAEPNVEERGVVGGVGGADGHGGGPMGGAVDSNAGIPWGRVAPDFGPLAGRLWRIERCAVGTRDHVGCRIGG